MTRASETHLFDELWVALVQYDLCDHKAQLLLLGSLAPNRNDACQDVTAWLVSTVENDEAMCRACMVSCGTGHPIYQTWDHCHPITELKS